MVIFRIFFESERGLSPNTEFVYDLEIPPDFIPENQDGEVESFHLVPIKVRFRFYIIQFIVFECYE